MPGPAFNLSVANLPFEAKPKDLKELFIAEGANVEQIYSNKDHKPAAPIKAPATVALFMPAAFGDGGGESALGGTATEGAGAAGEGGELVGDEVGDVDGALEGVGAETGGEGEGVGAGGVAVGAAGAGDGDLAGGAVGAAVGAAPGA
ncbi:RNA recognition motif-containing family protein [Salix suchowensis]|nr:RNA recognition motif-containing family protein [Salix suchowensis]